MLLIATLPFAPLRLSATTEAPLPSVIKQAFQTEHEPSTDRLTLVVRSRTLVINEKMNGAALSKVRYNRVSSKSNADETLFGESAAVKARKAATTLGAGAAAGGKASAPASASTIRDAGIRAVGFGSSARSQHAGSVRSAATSSTYQTPVEIAADDLDAIRGLALGASETSAKAERQARMTEAAAKTALAQERRRRIEAFEEVRQRNLPKSQLQVEEEEERERRRYMATRFQEEDTDEVKMFKALQQQAITVSIRDRQLAEKRENAEKERLAERMRDVQMEIARLEEVKRVEDRETQLRMEAAASARQIYGQLEERMNAKKAELAATRAEAERLVDEMKAAQAQQKVEAEAQRQRKADQLEEFLAINQDALRIKAARKAADVEEDKKMVAEMLAADARRAAVEAEKAAAAAAREAALFKVRGEVQRLQDNRSAIDELRARRDYEAGQRVERTKELERLRKQAAAVAELKRAAVEQLQLKQRRLAEEIEFDRLEFEEAARVQGAWLAAEEKNQRDKWEANRQHQRALLSQKESLEIAAKTAFDATQKEGSVIQEAERVRLERLREIRDAKVAELLEMGVDPKYCVALRSVDPGMIVKN